MVPPGSNGCDDVLDFLPRRFGCQPEPLTLGKQVVDACRAAVGADSHREVATFEADQRRGHEVVRRSQAPAAPRAEQRVIAGMVVVVGHGGIEDDAPE